MCFSIPRTRWSQAGCCILKSASPSDQLPFNLLVTLEIIRKRIPPFLGLRTARCSLLAAAPRKPRHASSHFKNGFSVTTATAALARLLIFIKPNESKRQQLRHGQLGSRCRFGHTAGPPSAATAGLNSQSYPSLDRGSVDGNGGGGVARPSASSFPPPFTLLSPVVRTPPPLAPSAFVPGSAGLTAMTATAAAGDGGCGAANGGGGAGSGLRAGGSGLGGGGVALSRLGVRLSGLESELAAVRGEKEALASELERWRKAHSALESELSASRAAVRSRVSELQDAAAAAAQRAAAAEDLATELRRQLEGRRLALEGVLAGRDRRISELQTSLASLGEELGAKEAERAAAAGQLRGMDGTLWAWLSELRSRQQSQEAGLVACKRWVEEQLGEGAVDGAEGPRGCGRGGDRGLVPLAAGLRRCLERVQSTTERLRTSESSCTALRLHNNELMAQLHSAQDLALCLRQQLAVRDEQLAASLVERNRLAEAVAAGMISLEEAEAGRQQLTAALQLLQERFSGGFTAAMERAAAAAADAEVMRQRCKELEATAAKAEEAVAAVAAAAAAAAAVPVKASVVDACTSTADLVRPLAVVPAAGACGSGGLGGARSLGRPSGTAAVAAQQAGSADGPLPVAAAVMAAASAPTIALAAAVARGADLNTVKPLSGSSLQPLKSAGISPRAEIPIRLTAGPEGGALMTQESGSPLAAAAVAAGAAGARAAGAAQSVAGASEAPVALSGREDAMAVDASGAAVQDGGVRNAAADTNEPVPLSVSPVKREQRQQEQRQEQQRQQQHQWGRMDATEAMEPGRRGELPAAPMGMSYNVMGQGSPTRQCQWTAGRETAHRLPSDTAKTPHTVQKARMSVAMATVEETAANAAAVVVAAAVKVMGAAGLEVEAEAEADEVTGTIEDELEPNWKERQGQGEAGGSIRDADRVPAAAVNHPPPNEVRCNSVGVNGGVGGSGIKSRFPEPLLEGGTSPPAQLLSPPFARNDEAVAAMSTQALRDAMVTAAAAADEQALLSFDFIAEDTPACLAPVNFRPVDEHCRQVATGTDNGPGGPGDDGKGDGDKVAADSGGPPAFPADIAASEAAAEHQGMGVVEGSTALAGPGAGRGDGHAGGFDDMSRGPHDMNRMCDPGAHDGAADISVDNAGFDSWGGAQNPDGAHVGACLPGVVTDVAISHDRRTEVADDAPGALPRKRPRSALAGLFSAFALADSSDDDGEEEEEG
ncbi:hypothetical protein VOLCADRAFT_98573 [Volvox carteri f. nagariensis]|uniref:Uncharacterized protein n=1 Tax=Volvox carteri f. nagariensis TaxID=3068 RepID=D8UFQ0_VOLCA|nr:uncharacterized protein VOLCADRAFT_98573 [Volvox carteri f. nagariensis]EFJ41416.1 hypothetical protein VOLCADRAFT_98573 [Volvox carteri f. nagariensis]|eukprot:XP_002957522.1 hypothetical protein VOLCADRAFT_98573 [Volvox carteri f. nagariensis]